MMTEDDFDLDLSFYQSDQDATWYALASNYEGARQYVYGVIDGHVLEPLYLSTRIEELLDISPTLIQLKSADDPLIERLPKEYTLYFSANAELNFDSVADHLRKRMNIVFDGLRKGLFHFYHPTVASYFFGLSEPEDTAAWLYPIESVVLYRQMPSLPNEWIGVLEPTQSAGTELDDVWVITASQYQALSTDMDEKDILAWAADSDIQAEEINWLNQRSVTSICERYAIKTSSLLLSLRQFVHDNNVDLEKVQFDEAKFGSLDQIEKLQEIKETVAKEINRG